MSRIFGSPGVRIVRPSAFSSSTFKQHFRVGRVANRVDRAGREYWEENWSNAGLPRPLDPHDQTLGNYVNLQLHHLFEQLLSGQRGFHVLEIGCANSIWPIYFHRHFSAHTAGLDYSEIGCARSRALLTHYEVPAAIHCGDLFDPPAELREKFDLVVSFGVVEHFEDTAECLRSIAAFLKPGGLLVTTIPNITGIVGWLQRVVDRAVYAVHVPLSREKLAAAHRRAGLTTLRCEYFLSLNLSAVNSGLFSTHPLNPLVRRIFSGVSKVVWWLERRGVRIPPNRVTSPYLIAVARGGGSDESPSAPRSWGADPQ